MEKEMEVDKTKISIDLPIYEYVRDAQLQHGLKYDDHRQYRSYCSRRIHRIRRSLNVAQSIAPSAKARHIRARKLMDISNGMVIEAGEKNQEYAEKMLVIPLFLAERAWSYAMQLKQEVSECKRRRFHLIRRLEKATEHANRFEKLVHDSESPCSDRTKREAKAYAAYINGLYKMERENWSEAKQDFSKSLVLYMTLSLSVKRETFREQYHQRIEELRASLRYCTFTLGEKPTVHKTKLPSTLQFNDIAFRHVRNLQDQESKQAAAGASAKDTTPAKMVGKPSVASPNKDPSSVKTTKATVPTPALDEDDEDEFEETKEAIDEAVSGEEEESETDSDDDNQEQSRGGGVTGLVKGWLGGAWS